MKLTTPVSRNRIPVWKKLRIGFLCGVVGAALTVLAGCSGKDAALEERAHRLELENQVLKDKMAALESQVAGSRKTATQPQAVRRASQPEVERPPEIQADVTRDTFTVRDDNDRWIQAVLAYKQGVLELEQSQEPGGKKAQRLHELCKTFVSTVTALTNVTVVYEVREWKKGKGDRYVAVCDEETVWPSKGNAARFRLGGKMKGEDQGPAFQVVLPDELALALKKGDLLYAKGRLVTSRYWIDGYGPVERLFKAIETPQELQIAGGMNWSSWVDGGLVWKVGTGDAISSPFLFRFKVKCAEHPVESDVELHLQGELILNGMRALNFIQSSSYLWKGWED